MNVRALGLAISLVLGMAACTTSRSQTRPSGSTETASSGEQGADTASSAAGSQTAGSQGGPVGALDPLMEPGPAIKGHASDQVVSGEVGVVSEDSVAIQSSRGDTKVLEIVPETSIVIDGMEGSSEFIEEGEPVRASFNELEGRDVAVEIQVGRAPSGRAFDLGAPSGATPGGLGSGSSETGSSDTGSGSSDTGSSGGTDSSSGGSSTPPGGSDSPGSSGTQPRW
jgi:hypothetical protein